SRSDFTLQGGCDDESRPAGAGDDQNNRLGNEDNMLDDTEEIESHLVFVPTDAGGGGGATGDDPSEAGGGTDSSPSTATAGLTIHINWDPSVASAPAGFQ